MKTEKSVFLTVDQAPETGSPREPMGLQHSRRQPEICRQYPTSRKHARMTGCSGFGTSPKTRPGRADRLRRRDRRLAGIGRFWLRHIMLDVIAEMR